MSSKRRISFLLNPWLALLVAGALAAATPAAADSPVVFALDSSRSLSPAENRAAADLSLERLNGPRLDGPFAT